MIFLVSPSISMLSMTSTMCSNKDLQEGRCDETSFALSSIVHVSVCAFGTGTLWGKQPATSSFQAPGMENIAGAQGSGKLRQGPRGDNCRSQESITFCH